MDVVPILSVSELTVVAEDSSLTVVDDFELSLFPGQITALVGESGSGKSLACLAIMNLLPSGLGRESALINFGAQRIDAMPENELRRLRGKHVAYVFQDPSSCLNPVLSIHTQLDEMLRAHFPQLSSSERLQRSYKLLAEVGLAELSNITNRYSHQLSGGQRQRLLLALSLAADPQVLIADEITTALDPQTQGMIVDLLMRLSKERELALVFITHDISLAKLIADQVLVMSKARVVEVGASHEIFSNPKHPVTQRLLQAADDKIQNVSNAESAELVLEAKSMSVFYKVPRIIGRAKLVKSVSGISFTLHHGQTLAIVGKSGSGKSTIARAVCGLAHQLEGELNLLVDNEIINLHDPKQQAQRAWRRHVSMIFQDPASSLNPLLPVHKSVSEPLEVHLALSRAELKSRALALLDEVGLDSQAIAGRLPSQLSGGQCQRVAIARALALNPAVMVCDEAISSLDQSAQQAIVALLLDLQKNRGLSYLFISHDSDLVSRVSHKVLSLT